MDLFRHVRIYFARFQALMLSHRSKEETHKYWTVPNDGNNAPSIYTGVGITADKASNERTENLVKIVKKLYTSPKRSVYQPQEICNQKSFFASSSFDAGVWFSLQVVVLFSWC